MAKKQTRLTVSQPVRPAAPFPQATIGLVLHPTAHASGAQAVAASQGIAITDKQSHEDARRLAKGWKGERLEVEAWYREKMVAPLKKAYDWARDQMNVDLELFDLAIAQEDRLDTQYVRQQQELEQREADERRRQAEADEQKRRDKEAAEAEAQALKIEASLSVLSPREDRFVFEWLKSAKTPSDAVRIARLCGFADPVVQASRLLKSKKISEAIANAQKVAAIRTEAEARKSAPIVVDVAPVESRIGKVSGTSMRTFYSCGEVDLKALILAVAEDIQHGDGSKVLALEANMVYLNSQARDLKEMFSRVHPYAQLVKRDGVAG